MRTPYASIAAILASVLALISGNALLNTLIPLRGKLEGFPSLALGLLGSVFFAAMLVGTLINPIVIKRLGYVRSYAVFAAIGVGAALAYPLFIDPTWWIALRAVMGFALAGLHGIIDGWVQGKADNENRGRMGAAYQVVHFIAAAAGQVLLNVADPRTASLFILAAILFAVSMAPLVLSGSEPPARPETARPELGWLLRNAPVAATASLGVGTANGSFWALFPVFGVSTGMSNGQISAFLAATVIGSAIAVWPIGRLSDRMDRRVVMAALLLAAAVFELALMRFGAALGWAMGAFGFLIGTVAMTVYPTALSHANDRAGPERSVAIASGILFYYCVGAILGPVTAVALMDWLSPQALFLFMALAHLVVFVTALQRIRMRPPAENIVGPETGLPP
jgi:MFS family permease